MEYIGRSDNSVTFEFSDEIKASKIAAQYNLDYEDHNNFAMQRRNVVGFMGQKMKERAIEEFSPELFGKNAVQRKEARESSRAK